MSLAVKTPPSALVVSLDEAKAHLRVDGTDEDAYIEALVGGVTALLDPPSGWLGRSLVNQTLVLALDGFPGAWGSPFIGDVPYGVGGWGGACRDLSEIVLPCPPLVASPAPIVTYVDSGGADQTLATSVYRVVGSGTTDSARLALAYGQRWPYARYQGEAVRIEYVAGYGSAGSNVPQPIRQALLLVVANLYANRGDVPNSPALFRGAPEALLLPYRIWA